MFKVTRTTGMPENVSLKEIVFIPIENIVTEERMFRAGQLHVTSSLPADKISVYREAKGS